MNYPDLLEAVIRRERVVVSLVLAVVITGSWLYLLVGAGTGMYPHQMAMLVPEPMSMQASLLEK